MGKIGNFGNSIVFETSDRRILTFSGFTQKVSAQWSSHKIIGQKSRSEFNGPELRNVSFTVVVDASLGVCPRSIIEGIERAIEIGIVDYLVIGGRLVGTRWLIKSMSEKWDELYSQGELVRATLNLSLEEYT